MIYEKFIQPKNIEIGGRSFAISAIPAIDALALNGIVTKSIVDNGIIGITMLPASADRQILSHTALTEGGVNIVIDTDVLINDVFKGRIGDLKELVIEMVKYNFGFLISGDLLDKLADRGEATDSAS